MATITTTIRWEPEELLRIKASAKKIGLPVALFIKSFMLGKVNEEKIDEQDLYSPQLVEELYSAQQEALAGKNIPSFQSPDEFFGDLKKHHNSK